MAATRHDALALAVAERLASHLTEVVDGLMDGLTVDLEAAQGWQDDHRERVREGVRQLALGFVRWLRIGDLEANHAERLRRLVTSPIPGAHDDVADDRTRTVRMDATDLIAARLGLDDQERRLVDRELDDYLTSLRPPEVHLADDDEEIDAWLARIEAGPRDVR